MVNAQQYYASNSAPRPVTPRIKGKRAVIILIVVLLIVFISAQILYWYVLPRITIDLKTVYHEATGGGGTGGLINVNSKFVNSGTVEVDNFKISITILNSTQIVLVNNTFDQDIVSPGDSHELKLTTNGNCFETFYIILEIQFDMGKNEYSKKYLYETHEDAMNIGFKDSIFDWVF
jgi:hypothetical protein